MISKTRRIPALMAGAISMKKNRCFAVCMMFLMAVSPRMLSGQTLTISSSGQTGTSGTNWSINGNILTVTGTADIRASVITTHLASNDLTIVGNSTVFTVTVNEAVTVSTGLKNLTLGNSTNTGSVSIAAAMTLNGGFTVFGGAININHNVNTTSGGANGDILLKGSADINLADSRSITTNGGDVILWANSDGQTSNGMVHIYDNSSISTSGGHLWMGGGSGTTTWNGLTVGDGWAYSGTTVTPASGTTFKSGIVFRRDVSINTNGGDFSAYGASAEGSSVGIGICTYGTVGIDVGAGRVIMDGRNTSSGARNGFLWGIHSSILGGSNSIVTISSSRNVVGENAIYLNALHGNSSRQAAYFEGPLNLVSTGSSGIYLKGENTAGGGSVLFEREANILSASGGVTLEAIGSGLTASVASTVGFKASTAVTASSADITVISNGLGGFSNITYNTTGALTIRPVAASTFSSAVNVSTNNYNSSISSLTFGSSSNTANITLNTALSIAGALSIYGGTVAINQNLTSTLSRAPILLQATATIALSASKTIQSNGGDITFRANSGGTGTSTAAITLNTGSSLLSQGGNITLGGNFTGAQGTGLYATGLNAPGVEIITATISAAGGNINIYGKCNTSYDDGIRLVGTINTTGTGSIALYGEAHGGNNATSFFGGISFFENPSTIETVDGNLTLSGLLTNTQSNSTGAINFYRSTGSAGQTRHINLLSRTGDITVLGDRGTTAAYGIGQSSWGNVYVGSPSNGSWTATGDVVFSYSSLVPAGSNGIVVNTTGDVTYQPSATSFSADQTFPANSNYVLATNAASLTIGKSGNTAGMTIGSNTSIAGPITLYAGTITLNANLTSTASGDISLYSDAALAGLSSARTITTSGAVKYMPNGTSFSSTVTFPITNLTLTNLTGLQLGKSGNTSGITIGTAASVNGYVTVFGGALALNANLTTTNTTTGDINLNGTTISGTGNLVVAAGRTATVNVSAASTYDGIISGTGSGLTKAGAGVLTLTKDHTYTGATTISAGDLQVGTGGSVSQASSGTISRMNGSTQEGTSGVSVASSAKLILTPNENTVFPASVSGDGGVEIKGASGKYWPAVSGWLSTTAVQLVANTTVLEALTRITGGKMGGSSISGGPVTCGAYLKSYNAANNTAILQLQAFNGDAVATYTKSVFIKLTQSGANVMIQVDNSFLTTGAGYKTGNVLGTDIASGGTSMPLATSGGVGYGISEVYMSGKVNFTGALTYTGSTVLSNAVSSLSTTYNAYSYTSKGTQEITDASSSFPGPIVNNGLVILNRSTALTISGDMSGTEDVLQVGAAVTLTGNNTHTGTTTINLNKELNIGSGGTTGSMTGNVVNYGAVTFNRSDASSYPGILSGTGTLTKSGAGALTMTALNTYTGATTINAGSLVLERDVPVTSSSGFSGAGTLVLQPASASFTSAVSYPISGFNVSSTIGGLQIGKPGNTAALTITSASSINGPVSAYTGNFTTNASATLTATSSALEVTASGNVTLNAALSGSTTTVNVAGNLQTIGTLTNVNLTGGNAQSLTGTATLNNLILNKTDGTTATITADRQDLTGTLTLTSGILEAGGKLVLKSNASGTARVAAHSGAGTGKVTGNVVVERFIPSTGPRRKQWRMLGFPYSADITPAGISGIGISYSGAQTMMLFNESADNSVYGTGSARNAGYAPLTAPTDHIQPGRGVATWIYGDNAATPATGTLTADLTISSQGPLNETGASVSLTGLSNNVQGWHLIGNPYASTIDWHVVRAASTNVASTLYRWDPQFEGWTEYNESGGSVGANASRYIESGSAFFIKRFTTGTIDVVIPQSAKDASNAPNLHFTKAPFRLDVRGERIGAASTLAGIRVKASGMGNPIPAEAYLDVSKVDATKGWDPKYDGMMMSRSAGANIYFDGAADNDYSMQFDAPLMTGEQRYYPLAVTTPALGETTIEINSEGRWSNMHSVALIDQQLGKTILMQGGEIKYKFKLEALKSEGRFLLAINHIKLDTDGKLPGFEVKALGNPVSGNTIDLLLTHPTATAQSWRVIDITGREAGTGTFAKDAGIQHRLTVPGMRNPGVYVVQVSMDNGETQQIRILKN